MYIFVGFFCLFRYFGMLLLSVSTMNITFPVRGSLQWVGEHPNIHISLIIRIACDIDIIWYLLCWSDDLQCIEFHCLEALPSPLMLLRRGDASLKEWQWIPRPWQARSAEAVVEELVNTYGQDLLFDAMCILKICRLFKLCSQLEVAQVAQLDSLKCNCNFVEKNFKIVACASQIAGLAEDVMQVEQYRRLDSFGETLSFVRDPMIESIQRWLFFYAFRL